jgi:N-acyl-D-aspartate/D-glutamate deacylase
MYDLLIKGGTVIDGTQTPRFFGDVAIKDGVIERIDNGIPAAHAKRVIDAGGKIVAPGVIDTHTHYDAPLFWDPYASNTGWHGGTTIAIGNCGFGFAPCHRDRASQDRLMLMMEHTEQIAGSAMREAMDWDWESFPDWIRRLRKLNKAVNVAAHVPLNALMVYVMGMEAAKTRKPTALEMDRMKVLLNEAMAAGAIGFAFTYQGETTNHVDFDGSLLPTDAMDLSVPYSLAQVLADRGHGCIQLNCDKIGVHDYRYVAEEVARISGQRVIYNTLAHFTSDKPEATVASRLAWLDEMERKGLNMYAQGTAFRYWTEFTPVDTNMWDPLLALRQFSVADRAEKLRLAASPEFRATLKQNYNPREMAISGGPFETYVLLDAKDAKRFKGDSGQALGAIAQRNGADIVDLMMDIIVESHGDAVMRTSALDNPELHLGIMRHKRAIAGTSDGGAHSKFWAGGYYATDEIKWWSRETGLVDLEVLHNRFSLLPARALGLHKRGALVEGWAADLYIYDYEKLDYPQAFEKKHDLPGGEWRVDLPSIGIEWTIVNGEPTLQGMAPTGRFPGRLVGNSGASIDEALSAPLAIAAE